MQAFLAAKQAEIAEICRTHHVRRLAVFGSAGREDFDPERSDVDVRVEFGDVSLDAYAYNFFSLHRQLEELFGCDVDVLSASTVRNPFLCREIEATQVTVYAA